MVYRSFLFEALECDGACVCEDLCCAKRREADGAQQIRIRSGLDYEEA